MARDLGTYNIDLWLNGFRNESVIAETFPVTLSCWVYVPATIATEQWLMGVLNSGDGNSNYYCLSLRGSAESPANRATASSRGTTPIALQRSQSTLEYPVGEWFHVAGVFNVGGVNTTITNRYVYLNGVEATPNLTDTNHPSSPFDWSVIGARDFNGNTDRASECRIMWPAWHTAALTAGEILELSRGVPPDRVRPSDLASWLRCDEQSMPHSYASLVDSADPSQTWVENSHATATTAGNWAAGTSTIVTAVSLLEVGKHIKVSGVTPAEYNLDDARIDWINATAHQHQNPADPGGNITGQGIVEGRIGTGSGPTGVVLPAGPKTMRTSPYSLRTI